MFNQKSEEQKTKEYWDQHVQESVDMLAPFGVEVRQITRFGDKKTQFILISSVGSQETIWDDQYPWLGFRLTNNAHKELRKFAVKHLNDFGPLTIEILEPSESQ